MNLVNLPYPITQERKDLTWIKYIGKKYACIDSVVILPRIKYCIGPHVCCANESRYP